MTNLMEGYLAPTGTLGISLFLNDLIKMEGH